MGVRINYVSGWKSSYVIGAAAHPHSCCSSSRCRESLWHGNKENNKITRFISPPRMHVQRASDLRHSLDLIWRESCHFVMYGCWFLRNVQRSVLVELFLVGVCLDGR